MKNKQGFNTEKYLAAQTQAIYTRVNKFNGKLYLEFGGKILYDYHASRVLPGFDPNVKMRLLSQLKDRADIIMCIYAGDIERKKIRADFGITYDVDVLKQIDDFREWGLPVERVVITRFAAQPAAVMFKNKLERRGIKVYIHHVTKGYPVDVDTIVSPEGYGSNAYIPTEKPIVIVTGPGPGSGKLATCLTLLYHDYKSGLQSGYAKFETFPIWNIPLKHPVNAAYEAATADLHDINMIDPFHLDAYGIKSVNYNRDIEAFPLVKRILQKITGTSIYNSPTDMGVNCAAQGITDDTAVSAAARQEIIRRYLRYCCEYSMGCADKETVERVKMIMDELGIKTENRAVFIPAHDAAESAGKQEDKGNEGIYCGAAILLPDGRLVTGKNSPLMHAASSLIFNAIKTLAAIPDSIHLLSPSIIDSIRNLKRDILAAKAVSLDLEEALIALSISATTNPTANLAMEQLKKLKGCEMHITHIPTPGDEAGLRRLGVNLTSDPNFSTKDLFIQ